jgi:hypothetical protein
LESTVGCVEGFVRFAHFTASTCPPENEDILDFMDIDNMSLGTPDPLHVYVKDDVELMEEIAVSESAGTLGLH